MKIIYRTDTLFIFQMILDTEGAATYTRSETTYPSASFADALLADNQSAVDSFRGGSAFRADVHPDPTTVNEITKTQLGYEPPADGSWQSGIDGMMFVVDDEEETFKEDIKITGIHASANQVIVTLVSPEAGIEDIITCNRNTDGDDYTWNSADNFITLHLSFKTLGTRGTYIVEAADPDGYKFHKPRAGFISEGEPPDDFVVREKREGLDAEFKFAESPNGALQTFTFPKQDVKLTPNNVEINDIFTAIINGTKFVFTATAATVANVTAGLKTLIDAGSEPVATTDNGTDLDIESDDIAEGFTIHTTAVDGGGADTQTLGIAITEPNSGAAKGTVAVYEDGVRLIRSDYAEDADSDERVTGVTFVGTPAGGVELKCQVLRSITEEFDPKINQKKFKGFKKKKK